jgi:hypothetical protein
MALMPFASTKTASFNSLSFARSSKVLLGVEVLVRHLAFSSLNSRSSMLSRKVAHSSFNCSFFRFLYLTWPSLTLARVSLLWAGSVLTKPVEPPAIVAWVGTIPRTALPTQ